MDDKSQRLISAVNRAYSEVSEHIKNKDQHRLLKGILNGLPSSLHDTAIQDYAKFRTRNADTSMTLNDAIEEAKGMIKQDFMRFCTPYTACTVLKEHGASFTQEELAVFQSERSHTAPKTLTTPLERVEAALNAVFDASERAEEFMSWTNEGESKPRSEELSGYLASGKPGHLHQYCLGKANLPVSGPAKMKSSGYDMEFYIHQFKWTEEQYRILEDSCNKYLIVPMANAVNPGTWSGWQVINTASTKNKRFMKGQPVKGQFYPIGELRDAELIQIAEGVATSETLHAATEIPTVAALSLGNLFSVAASLLSEDFEIRAGRVLICADAGHDDEMKKMVADLNAVFKGRAHWCKPEVTA